MKLVCFGDSNTWGYDPRSYFGDRYPESYRWPDLIARKTGWDVVNMGSNGQEIPNKSQIFPDNMDLLAVMLGTNDLLQGNSAEDTGMRMLRFLAGINCPRENIVLIVPPPMRYGEWVRETALLEESNKLSECYRKVAASVGVHYLDTVSWNISMAYDGVHFSESGHISFSDNLLSFLLLIC